MSSPSDLPCDRAVWQAFLARHRLGPGEQAAFLTYLTRPHALPVGTVQDLEDDYLEFLHSGGSPEAA